ncbi:LacI family DNA-binding transcriptional regulator [Bacillus sp. FJAT-50079]|uniref:LacI family DNA-binding transcriptional regulator n=1 Tax=Bacillus sp. FJAT-50079 TaxID=2833577 RepID=UPI0020163CE9|nr:LacI family DNA-binding transcriptional regulator [Bacillus sp. FJAT-50079]
MKDIAKKAGVSVATVSYVLNNTRYVSPEKKESVLRAVKELNYVPNAAARGLRSKTSRTLGLILSDITNPFYPDLSKGSEDATREAGYSLIIVNTNEQEEKMHNASSLIREGKVDGLIVASALKHDKLLLEQLQKEGHHIVLAHRSIAGLQMDTVATDNMNGAYDASRYLLSLGHHKIAMFTGIDESIVNTERKNGFLKALNEYGVEPILFNTRSNYELAYNMASEFIKLPKNERPTAIFAINDVVAFGILDALQNNGLKVPDDLAIIGYDDIFIPGTRAIQLSSVRVPRYEIGYQAAKILIDRIEGKKSPSPIEVILPTQLVIRKTCGSMLMRNSD